MRRFLLLLAVLAIAVLPGPAAAEPPADAPGCPPGFFLTPVGPGLPGEEADRNQNGLVCNNGREEVFIDDRVGGP